MTTRILTPQEIRERERERLRAANTAPALRARVIAALAAENGHPKP